MSDYAARPRRKVSGTGLMVTDMNRMHGTRRYTEILPQADYHDKSV